MRGTDSTTYGMKFGGISTVVVSVLNDTFSKLILYFFEILTNFSSMFSLILYCKQYHTRKTRITIRHGHFYCLHGFRAIFSISTL